MTERCIRRPNTAFGDRTLRSQSEWEHSVDELGVQWANTTFSGRTPRSMAELRVRWPNSAFEERTVVFGDRMRS